MTLPWLIDDTEPLPMMQALFECPPWLSLAMVSAKTYTVIQG